MAIGCTAGTGGIGTVPALIAGGLITVRGADEIQAGLRQLITGQNTNTATYDAVKGLTGNEALATGVDFGTGLISGGGAVKAISSLRKADAVGTLGEEGGNLVSKLLYGGRPGENLPGKGIEISARPTPSELEALTVKHNVEFAVTYKYGLGENGGGGKYFLHSGDIDSVRIPLVKDSMLIYHTHPGGTQYASEADQRLLEYLQKIGSPQRSSQIVPVDKEVIRFNTKYGKL